MPERAGPADAELLLTFTDTRHVIRLHFHFDVRSKARSLRKKLSFRFFRTVFRHPVQRLAQLLVNVIIPQIRASCCSGSQEKRDANHH